MIIYSEEGRPIKSGQSKRGIKKGTKLISTSDRKMLKKLGARVKAERLRRNWTLYDTEEHGFSNWSHWQYIESGKKNINFSTLMKICRVLGLRLSDLAKGL